MTCVNTLSSPLSHCGGNGWEIEDRESRHHLSGKRLEPGLWECAERMRRSGLETHIRINRDY
jgi:hypothetical protein